MRWVHLILGTALLAGCGAPGVSGISAMSPSPSASASASASPSASSPPLAVAMDGTNYAACADGTCEVALPGPVQVKLRRATLSVTRVEANVSLDFELALSTGSTGSGTLRGGCGAVTTFYLSGGLSSQTCRSDGVIPTPQPVAGAVSMQFVGWTVDGAAVIRFVSG